MRRVVVGNGDRLDGDDMVVECDGVVVDVDGDASIDRSMIVVLLVVV